MQLLHWWNPIDVLERVKTQERVNDGNLLYGFVARYCEVGKIIWQDVDEAKYNDYVIYHTTTQMPGKVLNMAYDVPTKTVSWDVAAHADKSWSGTGGFAFFGESTLPIHADLGGVRLRVRDGDDASTRLCFSQANELKPHHSYRVFAYRECQQRIDN